MEVLIITSLLFGPVIGVLCWLVAAAVGLALVLPRIRRAGQPVAGWAVATIALPVVAYGIVGYKLG